MTFRPDGQMLKRLYGKARELDRHELEKFYADAHVLLAAVDLAIHRSVLGSRTLIADARLAVSDDTYSEHEAEAFVFGGNPHGQDD